MALARRSPTIIAPGTPSIVPLAGPCLVRRIVPSYRCRNRGDAANQLTKLASRVMFVLSSFETGQPALALPANCSNVA